MHIRCYWFLVIAIMLSGCTLFTPPREIITPPTELLAYIEEIPQDKQQAKSAVLPEYENLIYDLRWLGIHVGNISATIDGVEDYNGRDTYKFSFRVTSNAWLSKIYHIDSVFTSYTDVEHFHTLREEVDRKEGRYRKHAAIEYDQTNHVAHFESYTDGTRKSFDIPANVQDGLSSVYYFRTHPLEVDDHLTYPIVLSESIYDFFADVLAVEAVNVGHYGKQQGIRVEPKALLNGEQVKEGSMIGYFEPGPTKIPLYATIKTPLFTRATATLRDIQYSRSKDDSDTAP